MLSISRPRAVAISGICLWALWAALPNLPFLRHSALGNILPQKTLKLGLDLQGGSHLLLEVDAAETEAKQNAALAEQIRTRLRNEKILYDRIGLLPDGSGVEAVLKDSGGRQKTLGVLADLLGDLEADTVGVAALHLRYSAAYGEARLKDLVRQSIEIVRRRVDATGVSEPLIQRQGDRRIVLELPGLDDPEEVKRLLGKTAKMGFHLVADRAGADTVSLPQKGGGILLVRRHEELSGEYLEDAKPTYQEGRPVVAFSFDAAGSRQFGEITRRNIGTRLAIVLDDQVISAPVIEGQIVSNGVISGRFSLQEANDLAILLRAGALPAPLKILEERTVGPSLGSDSVAAGQKASLAGLACIFLFMPLVYGRIFGLIADIALGFNILLILAILSLLQATLTLPGIAGLVLTMGMAVDANVLIFERIKEEKNRGLHPATAVEYGYHHAHASIMDANITTLLVGLILYVMGSGTVQGFGVTLSVGIFTSYFSGVHLSRFLSVLWIRLRRPKTLPL